MQLLLDVGGDVLCGEEEVELAVGGKGHSRDWYVVSRGIWRSCKRMERRKERRGIKVPGAEKIKWLLWRWEPSPEL